MVNYDKLLQKPDFWSLNNRKLLVEPYKYGGASLRGQKLNQGVRAILHGNEWIIPAKFTYMIPKRLKEAIKEENKKI
jgi:hypothetical protein